MSLLTEIIGWLTLLIIFMILTQNMTALICLISRSPDLPDFVNRNFLLVGIAEQIEKLRK